MNFELKPVKFSRSRMLAMLLVVSMLASLFCVTAVAADESDGEPVLVTAADDATGDAPDATGDAPEVPGDATGDAPEIQSSYEDVPNNHWALSFIEDMTAKGLMGSVSSTSARFAPNGNVTREMVVTVLYRQFQAMMAERMGNLVKAADEDADEDVSEAPVDATGDAPEAPTDATGDAPADEGFVDVEDGKWYTEAITWAKNFGIALGGDGNKFGVGQNVTREDLATFIHRAAGAPAPEGSLDSFADGDQVDGYAKDAVAWCVEQGIISGKPHNMIDPRGYATRAEMAKMVSVYLSTLA